MHSENKFVKFNQESAYELSNPLLVKRNDKEILVKSEKFHSCNDDW